MAAQGFLLTASFLLILFVLARPLGVGLARLINDIPRQAPPAQSVCYGAGWGYRRRKWTGNSICWPFLP